jgi:TonB-dependent starch-binding outer membrane protein SusC
MAQPYPLKPSLTALLLLALMLIAGRPAPAQVYARFDNRSAQPRPETTQQRPVQTTLAQVLAEIRTRYAVSFLYQKKNVEGKMVTGEVRYSQPLAALLTAVLTPNGLNFERINATTYTIYAGRTRKSTAGLSDPDPAPARELSAVSQPETTASLSMPQARPMETERAAAPAELVRGRVTSAENGEALPGVTVVVKGASVGVTTNATGDYQLNVPTANATLVFSSVGYVAQEIAIGGRGTVNAVLLVDTRSLSEVVVIGYGTRNRRDLTGSVADIRSTDIQRSVALSPEVALQGRLAGVSVTSAGGDPNARPTVRIRGVTTFGNNADPLYIIDGVPVAEFGQGTTYTVEGLRADDLRGTQNVFNLINPNDIESISVLKDAASAAVYGVRAANGVILITTKRGREGRPRINFTASRGVQNIRKRLDLLNTGQAVSLYQEAIANNKLLDRTNPDVAANINFFDAKNAAYVGNLPTYDAQDDLINKNAVIENYSLGISGGTQTSNYNVSVGYSNQEGSLNFNNQKRYTLSVASDFRPRPWIEFGETVRLAYADVNDQRNSTGVPFDYLQALRPPWQTFTGTGRADGLAVVENSKTGFESFINFPGLYRYSANTSDVYRTLASGYATLIPLPGLRIKGTVSVDYISNQRTQYFQNAQAVLFKTDGNAGAGNQYSLQPTQNFNITRELSANYVRSFGEHTIDLLVNASDQSVSFQGLNAGVSNIPTESPATYTLSSGDPTTLAGSSFRESWALQGYIGRLSYKFRDKYYLDGTVIRNGSSRFAPAYRFGTFPAVSAGWRISQEPFMKAFGFINDLKIRASYGQLGNQDTRSFAFLSTVSRNPQYSLGNGAGQPNTGAVLGDYANPSLTWEKVTTSNLGIDAAFLNNTLTVTAEYYSRQTKGILQAVNFPLTAGLNSSPVFNLADVSNKGIELAIGYRNRIGELDYTIGGNLTTVKNEVLTLYNDQPVGGNTNRIQVGSSINSFFGYQTDGIFQSQEDVRTWLAANKSPGNTTQLAPGDIRFRDLYSGPNQSGQPDGTINDFDQTILGKSIPGYYYGITLGGTYKNFDLSVLFQGVGDVQRFNVLRPRGEDMSNRGRNQLATTLDRWTPTNPSNTMPRAIYEDPSGNTRFSNRWIENAGFLRLNNLQLGYSLPKPLLGKLGNLDNVRLYVQTTNAFVITGYSGPDPENDVNPTPRSLLFGLNVSF